MDEKRDGGRGAAITAAGEAASALDDAAGRAGAALDRLVREGEDAERSGHERVAVVMTARAELEARLVGLVGSLAADLDELALDFEDIKRGPTPKRSFLRRQPAPRLEPGLFLVFGEGVSLWLKDAGRLLEAIAGLRDALKGHHSRAEGVLESVIARRGTALAVLEAAQKASEERRPGLKAIALALAGPRKEEDAAPLQAERERLQAAFDAVRAEEAACLVRYKAEDELVALFDVHLDGLNATVAALNAMLNRLDAEAARGVLLREAVSSFALRAGARPARLTDAGAGARIDSLFSATHRGLLNHEEMAQRRAVAEEAFARRFASAMPPPGAG